MVKRLSEWLVVACCAVAGCSTETAPTNDEGTQRFASYLDARYCEVLVGTPAPPNIIADVWNSLPFGTCPQQDWDELDPAAIGVDFPDATLILLNGPRFFLMQTIEQDAPPTDPETHVFGAIEMVLAATVTVDPTMTGAYVERSVDRSTTFHWDSQKRVFELSNPEGTVYVMQSFSQGVDPTLSYEDLEGLGTRLVLPAGWSFSSRVLDADLDVVARGVATVVQDELGNTYQLRD